VEPNIESGVFGMVMKLCAIEPSIFPFQLLDYNTHTGIDAIVKGDHTTPIHQSRLLYLEFKYFLGRQLNHSFRNVCSIVCWDTEVKNGDFVEDINGESRRMRIVEPLKEGDYTGYFLEPQKKGSQIEVYVLKDYLREKYAIEFRPRTESSFANK